MKKESPWSTLGVAAAVLAVCYVLGGCCLFGGLDLKNDGKSVDKAQVAVGIGIFVVPTVLVVGMFLAHLLGFRPGPTARDKLQSRIRAMELDISPLQAGEDAEISASWAPVAQLSYALDHLGEMEATFKKTDNRQALFNLAACVVACIAGVLALAGIGVAAALGHRNFAVFAAILGTLGSALLIGGAIGIVVLMMPHDLRVIICEKGIVRVEGKKFLVFIWDDVIELYQTIVDMYAYGLVHTSREYGFRLYRCDGELMEIYEGINVRDIGRLSDTLQAKIARIQLPGIKKRLTAGEEIVFGPLAISKKGVSNGDEMVRWRDVQGVQVVRGVITIQQDGASLSWSKVRASEIPNLHVFLSLVDQIIGVNQ